MTIARKRDCLENLNRGCSLLKNLDLCSVIETTTVASVTEDQCIAWMVMKHGWTTVFHVASALGRLPDGLTHHSHQQRRQLISDFSCGLLTVNQVDPIASLMEMVCPSLLSSFKSRSTDVLAPPVRQCFECSSDLTANHKCTAKTYGVDGMKEMMKVTLRCQKCGLFYNYSQYGNKHEVRLH